MLKTTFISLESMPVRGTASTYAAVALDMAQVLPSPKAEPSCQSLSRPQTHKDKGRAPPEERVQEGCSSDEGEPDRAGQIVADAELCEELQRAERRQAHDVTTAAAAAAAAVTAAAAANVTFTTGSDAAAHTVDAVLAAPVATCTAAPVAAFATATAQTLLPAGTYQPPPPLPWDVMQYMLAPQQQLALAEHGEPRHFNAQGDPVNSHGNPYVQPPPAGLMGSNGGSHASWKKREKEKAKRQQKAAAKRVATAGGE